MEDPALIRGARDNIMAKTSRDLERIKEAANRTTGMEKVNIATRTRLERLSRDHLRKASCSIHKLQ